MLFFRLTVPATLGLTGNSLYPEILRAIDTHPALHPGVAAALDLDFQPTAPLRPVREPSGSILPAQHSWHMLCSSRSSTASIARSTVAAVRASATSRL